jgi:AraC-like DNA-binding protein
MPYKIDLFAIFIFLGIVQAVFLSFFFLSGENRKSNVNLFCGILLISEGACILEIFLMYTGYIINCLYLVDFSEPFALLIGPSFYLIAIAITRKSIERKHYLHLAFPVIYFMLLIPYLLQSEDVKFNSWVEAYNLNIPFRDLHNQGENSRAFWITDHATQIILLSIIIYSVLSLYEAFKYFQQKRDSFWNPANPLSKYLRTHITTVSLTVIMILIIKFFNSNDTGDHIFAAFVSVSIYLTSIMVMQQSGFFKQASVASEKYKSSSLTPQDQQALLNKLKQLMNETKPFLSSEFSLPELAQKLGTSVHMVSQIINAGMGKSFFEMTAEYRVEEAKLLLLQQKNIKVEDIAEQVGYNSKSSFNTAFKKITGRTPSEFRMQKL